MSIINFQGHKNENFKSALQVLMIRAHPVLSLNLNQLLLLTTINNLDPSIKQNWGLATVAAAVSTTAHLKPSLLARQSAAISKPKFRF